MRTQQDFLEAYSITHRNPVNVRLHTICVPLIFLASVGMLWTLPLGRWFGLADPIAPWINGATIAAAPLLVFYASLSLRAFLEMVVVFALSVAIVLMVLSAGAPLFALSAGLWLAAWIGQFYGHHVERAKPAFLDDLLFLAIGPLFVLEKLGLLGGRRPVVKG
jgi:uncharacterized membrane protein YGL010W